MVIDNKRPKSSHGPKGATMVEACLICAILFGLTIVAIKVAIEKMRNKYSTVAEEAEGESSGPPYPASGTGGGGEFGGGTGGGQEGGTGGGEEGGGGIGGGAPPPPPP